MNIELEFIKSKGLECEFEKFKKIPKWEIKRDKEYDLCLFKNDGIVLWFSGEMGFKLYTFHNLIYDIAYYMNCLISKEQLFNGEKNAYCVYYDICAEEWQVAWNRDAADASYIIDTYENALKIADLLNNSEDLKKWMER